MVTAKQRLFIPPSLQPRQMSKFWCMSAIYPSTPDAAAAVSHFYTCTITSDGVTRCNRDRYTPLGYAFIDSASRLLYSHACPFRDGPKPPYNSDALTRCIHTPSVHDRQDDKRTREGGRGGRKKESSLTPLHEDLLALLAALLALASPRGVVAVLLCGSGGRRRA